MISMVIVASLVLIAEMRRRVPIYAACFMVAAYSAISMILLLGVTSLGWGDLIYPDGYITLLIDGADYASLIFFGQCLIAWIASFASASRRQDDHFLFGNGLPAIISTRSIAFALSILTFGLLAHAIVLDWGKYWFTSFYTTQHDPYEMGVTWPPAVVFHYLMPVTLVATGSAFLFYASWRRWGIACWSASIFLYCWIYELAGHSRWAGASVLLSAGAYSLFKGRRRTLVLCIGVPIFVLAFVQARIGRNSGEHGLSTLFSTWEYFDPEQVAIYLIGLCYSVFQGINAIAASMTVHAGQYPLSYKILSFSPLPTFIDGFAAVHRMYEVRLNATNPLSAWVEALRFGWQYIALLYGTLLTLLSLNAKLAKSSRSPIIVTLSVLTVALTMFLAAYEVRNVYRFVLLVTLVHAWLLYRRRNRPVPPGPGYRRAGPVRPTG